MNGIGQNVKRLRQSKGITQEQLAEQLHISAQAVSKWECSSASPDVMLLPVLADIFGISIDELFGYKHGVYTEKERLIRLMAASGVLTFSDIDAAAYHIDSEKLTTNAQIAKIGSYFADCIQENHLTPDAIMGIAYHGIAFSAAAAFSLFEKYGITTHYGHDRRVPDSHGNWFCGYIPQDGDRIVVVDDLIYSGKSITERLVQICTQADVQITGILVIVGADSSTEDITRLENTFNTTVYPLITTTDIHEAFRNGKVY